MKKIVLTAIFVTLAAPAFAVTATEWQADLQTQLGALQAMTPGMVTSGAVAVMQKDNQLIADIPTFKGSDKNGRQWVVPALKINRSIQGVQASNDWVIIPQGDVLVTQSGAKTFASRTKWARAELGFPKKDAMTLNIQDIQVQQTLNQVAASLSIKKARITYISAMPQRGSLVQLFTILQQQFGKQPLLAVAELSDLQYRANNSTISMAQLTARSQVTPVAGGKTVTIRNAIKVGQFAVQPMPVMGSFMPRDVDMVGTVSNMPISLLNSVLVQPPESVQQALVESQTKISLDSLTSRAVSGAVLTAQGQVRPALNVPTGLVGRMTVTLKNLQQAVTQLQQQTANPVAGQGMAEQAQAMLGVMMLQTLMKQQPTGDQQYVLDLTPDGQVLLDGKDMAPLVRLLTGGNSVIQPLLPPPPAMPQEKI